MGRKGCRGGVNICPGIKECSTARRSKKYRAEEMEGEGVEGTNAHVM